MPFWALFKALHSETVPVIGVIFQNFWDFQAPFFFLFVCAVWIPPPPLSLLALAMSVAPRTICYAGSWDQVGVCHSRARSFTVVGCLSPRDTTSRGKQHDTDHGRLPHTEGMYRGRRSYVALICSCVTLISRQDGQADGICYGGVIPLSVMQQLLVLCWR